MIDNMSNTCKLGVLNVISLSFQCFCINYVCNPAISRIQIAMRYQTELIIIIYLQPAEPGPLLKQPSVQDFLISSLLSGYF